MMDLEKVAILMKERRVSVAMWEEILVRCRRSVKSLEAQIKFNQWIYSAGDNCEDLFSSPGNLFTVDAVVLALVSNFSQQLLTMFFIFLPHT